MARGFAGADTSIMVYGAQGLAAFPYGSMFLAIRRNAVVGGTSRIMLLLGAEAAIASAFAIDYTTTTERVEALANAASFSAGPTATTINLWSVIGFTKATGAATPVMHQYYWSTNTWVHENAAGNVNDSTGTAHTSFQIGGLSAGGGGGAATDLLAEVAAAMVIKSRVMSTGEIERLPSGNWDRYNPDLLLEYPSGRDNPGGINRDVSRNRMRQTSGGSTTVRPALADPPGFRYSRLKRRQ